MTFTDFLVKRCNIVSELYIIENDNIVFKERGVYEQYYLYTTIYKEEKKDE